MPVDLEPDDAERLTWDAIVIGTGMGRRPLGWELARSGQRILFLEKGPNTLPVAAEIACSRVAEDFGALPDATNALPTLAALQATGRSIDEVEDVTGRNPDRFTPYLGNGVDGASALYGMALERFFPADFTARCAASIPESPSPAAQASPPLQPHSGITQSKLS